VFIISPEPLSVAPQRDLSVCSNNLNNDGWGQTQQVKAPKRTTPAAAPTGYALTWRFPI